MSDHSALIERLEERVAYDKRHFTVDPLHAEAAAALRDLTEWRPIVTAPTGAVEMIGLCGPKDIRLIWYFYPSSRTQGWCDQNGKRVYPTHWLPLPSAPNQAKEDGE